MKCLRKHTRSLLLFCAILPGAILQAEVVMSDPIGSISVTLKAGSDTRFSIPMMRTPVFTGEIKAVDEATDSIELANVAWADGQFIFGDADNPDANATYFAVVTSGNQNGAQYKIVSNDATTLSVEPGLNTLTGLASSDVDGSGDTIKVYPYPTLASVFSGVTVPDGTQVFEYNDLDSNINKSAAVVYSYFASSDVWIDGVSVVNNTALLQVGEGYVVRVPEGNSDIQLRMSGAVAMFNDRQIISNDAGTTNDINFALTAPVPVAIGNTNLGIQDGVNILVFDSQIAAFNKSASTVLTYFASSDVWIDGASIVNDTFFLEPSVAYVLRKPETAVAEVVETSFIPSYLQP